MHNKKLITTLGVSLALVGSLFGCGNNKSANVQTQPATVKQESTTKSAETATLPAVDNKPVVDATEASTENTTVENTEAAVENVETPAVNSENVEAPAAVVETPVEVPVEVIEQVTEAPVVETPAPVPVEAATEAPQPASPVRNDESNSNNNSNSSSNKVASGSFGATSVDELPTNASGNKVGHITNSDGSITTADGTFKTDQEMDDFYNNQEVKTFAPGQGSSKK